MTRAIVTDHALIRWLERAHDIDMEHFRALLGEIAEPFARAGVMHAEVGGLWLVFDGPKLVTVTPTKPGPAQTHRHARHAVNGTGIDRTEHVHWKWKKRKGWK